MIPHHLTLATLILLSAAILGRILLQARYARRRTERQSRLRRNFRDAYAAWKAAERDNDGSAYLHRMDAENLAIALGIRQA